MIPATLVCLPLRVYLLVLLGLSGSGCVERSLPGAPPRPTVDLAPPATSSSVSAAPAVPDPEPVLEPGAIFVQSPRQAFPRRALLTHKGPLQFSHGGAAAGPDEREALVEPTELVVLEDGPDHVRVLATSEASELAVYVPVRDLAVTTKEVAELELAVAGPIDARVVLLPGAPLEVDTTPGLVRKASLRDPRIELHGTLPMRAVGRVFVPAERETPSPTHSVDSPASVLASPRGVVVAQLKPTELDWLVVRLLEGPIDGHCKIALHEERFSLEGWVPEGALMPGDARPTHLGGISGWGSSSSFELPGGTILYGGPEAPQVGRLLTAHTVSGAAGLRDKRAPINLYLKPWGFIQVWIDKSVAETAWEKRRMRQRDARHVVFDRVVTQSFADATDQLAQQAEDLASCARGELGPNEPLPDGSFDVLIRLLPSGQPERATVSRVTGGLLEVANFRSCAEQALLVRAKPLDGKKALSGSIRATVRLTRPKP